MSFRQNLVNILQKISDNVTAPLLLGLLLRLFKDSLYSTTTPGQNLSPTDRRHCDLGIFQILYLLRLRVARTAFNG